VVGDRRHAAEHRGPWTHQLDLVGVELCGLHQRDVALQEGAIGAWFRGAIAVARLLAAYRHRAMRRYSSPGEGPFPVWAASSINGITEASWQGDAHRGTEVAIPWMAGLSRP
jgi:hypothetical protein